MGGREVIGVRTPTSKVSIVNPITQPCDNCGFDAAKRKPTHLLVWGILAMVLGGHGPLQAGEKQTLFDGQSLAGWSGDENIWSVHAGQIVGTTVGNPIEVNTFLVWQGGEVGDFRLTFRARVVGDNNSGVQYRSKLIDPKTYQARIQRNVVQRGHRARHNCSAKPKGRS